MGKSKHAIDEAVHAYEKRLREYLPNAETEVIYQPGDGHDVWINIKTSVRNPAEREQLLRWTVKLDLDVWDKTGVSIVGFIIAKQPEGAHHG